MSVGKGKYITVDDIPIHIFTDKMCTQTPSKELQAYLSFMLKNHPDDLVYLWRKMQEYKNHGGQWPVSFKDWKVKLKEQLKKDGVK